MPRRVLFVIRGKLGDTLVAFATVRCYADSFPEDEVLLLTRAGYAGLLAGEENIRVVGFSSRAQMLYLLLKLRLAPAFDALLVLWGFGTPIKWIGQLVKAHRKVFLDARYSDIYPEYADLSPHRLQSEPMWRVAQVFEPRLPQPDHLHVPSLAAKRKPGAQTIGVAPLADEARRIMSADTVMALLRLINARHPGAPVRLFVNKSDRGAQELIDAPMPPGTELHFFPELVDLVSGLSDLSHLYCTDTGLYHLAAAMGIPATVFFGPTQPWKNVMPGQSRSKGVRLTVLGDEHCEQKACTAPACLDNAVRVTASESVVVPSNGTPAGCPLRAYPTDRLANVSWHENPSHQA
jgi:ADP-heptose:LPS heptosyltransferase